ncbi:MAG TPA: TIR domain-containing protein [Crinalium sp.]|jgi:hypothetical protein
MSDVFISYSRKDKAFVETLYAALEVHNRSTWVDWSNIPLTADWWQEIEAGIEAADTFVFVISPDSVASKVCTQEVDHVVRCGKRLFPILRRDGFEMSQVHAALQKHNWLFFRETDKFDQAFSNLLKALDTDLEYVRQHTRLLLRAIEWNNKGRSESLLLRGDDLEQAEQWLNQNQGKEPEPTELQHTYVSNSRSVEDANQQAAQILRAAAEQGRRLVRVGAVAGLIGLLIAGSSGWATYLANQERETAKREATSARQEAGDAKAQANRAQQEAKTAKQAQDKARRDAQAAQQQQQLAQKQVIAAQQQLALASVQVARANQSLQQANVSRAEALAQANEAREQKRQAEAAVQDAQRTLMAANARLKSAASNERFLAGRVFDALLAALGAGQQLKPLDQATRRNGGAQAQVMAALSQAVYGVNERNTLSGHQFSVSSVSFSPDGKTLASGSWDNSIKLWNVETGELIRTLPGHQSSVRSVSFSPDGKTLASGSGDKTIKLWNVETGELIRTLMGHQSSVRSMSLSSDGKTLASGSDDNSIKLWNVETGELIGTLTGHLYGVWSVSFSPDGKTLASGSGDKTIKLWNMDTGELIGTLTGHQSSVWSVSFSPDGKTLASGSADSTIKLWVWDADRLMSMGCNWIRAYLITHPQDRPLCQGYLP